MWRSWRGVSFFWHHGLCMFTICSLWHICITMTDTCGSVLFWFTCHYFCICCLTGGQNVLLHYVWNNYVILALSLPSLWRPLKNSGLMPEDQWDAHVRIWKEGRRILASKINVCQCKTIENTFVCRIQILCHISGWMKVVFICFCHLRSVWPWSITVSREECHGGARLSGGRLRWAHQTEEADQPGQGLS